MCSSSVGGALMEVGGIAGAAFTGGSSLALLAAGTAAVGDFAQNQMANANAKMINQQEAEQQNQISQQAGQQAGQLAMQARAQRAAAVAGASASGVNLGSNSVLGSLQTTNEQQANQMGLITQNLENQREASQTNAQSELDQKATSKTLLGSLTDMGLAYGESAAATSAAKARATPSPGGLTGGSGGLFSGIGSLFGAKQSSSALNPDSTNWSALT